MVAEQISSQSWLVYMCLELPLVSLVTSHLTVTGTHASLCVTHWAGQWAPVDICNTRTQASSTRNIVGRGKLITKAEISEVTNVCFVQL